MEVLAVWGKVDSEIQTKVKYAKYHAVRIQKALKAGDDPNLSNPVQVPESAPKDNGDQIPLAPSPIDGARYQAYVEDAPEHNDTSLIPYSSPQSFKPMPPNPSTTAPVFREMSPSLPQTESEPHQQQDDVSPIESAQSERVSSAGGGYFPQGPAMPSNLPIGPAPVTSTGSPFTPVPSAPILPSAPPSGVYPSQSPLPQSVQFGTTPPPSEKRQAPQHQLTTPPPPNFAYNQQAASGQQFTPAPIPSYTVPTYAQEVPNQITQYNRDDQAILDAQKHAKWAVSALNFEDVETAVKELRIALQALGAR
jgi:vacuolar protein sorting-associated protein VTA1